MYRNLVPAAVSEARMEARMQQVDRVKPTLQALRMEMCSTLHEFHSP